MTDASSTSPPTAQPDPTPSSRRPDLEVSEVTGSGVSGGPALCRAPHPILAEPYQPFAWMRCHRPADHAGRHERPVGGNVVFWEAS